ncbi:autotransporter outer membrane beta-barrel domain-containing protein [Mangrovicoccus sp. HB161399]|uniref:autotransporter outer membrane beta-barrel domain-containing protein n=1 Tax=Mangrovicoccus sp. HB161399 TaxID=2720392 RepID=UPI0015541A04|nr:autotransporter outer membrane beta-barrel domain-containing protein [Mangrovicoccus sp. HB161399]
MRSHLILPAFGLAALVAIPALAQSGPPDAWSKFSRTFGPTGLWSELGQDEAYGAVQTRAAMARSQINAANADQDFAGYEDTASKIATPATLAFSLPGGNAALRLKGTWTRSEGDENKTYADSEGISGLASILFMPTGSTLLGFGLVTGQVDVDIRHNDGTIDSDARGIRLDLLQNLNDHWGIAARAIYTWNDTDTMIPLGFADLETSQENEQLYAEAALIGNIEHGQWSVLPEGWVLRPKLRGLYQKTSFETVRNSLGGTNEGTVGKSDEYATVKASVRLLKAAFRPGDIGPYAEIGYEREVINDLDLVIDEPDILATKIGVASILPNGDFLDVNYGRFDGFGGERQIGTLTIAYTHAF